MTAPEACIEGWIMSTHLRVCVGPQYYHWNNSEAYHDFFRANGFIYKVKYEAWSPTKYYPLLFYSFIFFNEFLKIIPARYWNTKHFSEWPYETTALSSMQCLKSNSQLVNTFPIPITILKRKLINQHSRECWWVKIWLKTYFDSNKNGSQKYLWADSVCIDAIRFCTLFCKAILLILQQQRP